MKPGPRKTPTNILKIRGSKLASERAQQEYEPTAEPIEPPSWIGHKARQHWEKLQPMLVAMGLMNEAFGPALALLVDAIADYVEVSEALVADPTLMVKTRHGMVLNPLIRAKGDIWRRVLAALQEFGLSPSSIADVKSSKGEKKTEGIDGYKLG